RQAGRLPRDGNKASVRLSRRWRRMIAQQAPRVALVPRTSFVTRYDFRAPGATPEERRELFARALEQAAYADRHGRDPLMLPEHRGPDHPDARGLGERRRHPRTLLAAAPDALLRRWLARRGEASRPARPALPATGGRSGAEGGLRGGVPRAGPRARLHPPRAV